jgi:hypothetical protein
MNIRKRKALKAKARAAEQVAPLPTTPVAKTPAPAPTVESETPLLDAVEAEEVAEVAPKPKTAKEPVRRRTTTRKKTTKEN